MPAQESANKRFRRVKTGCGVRRHDAALGPRHVAARESAAMPAHSKTNNISGCVRLTPIHSAGRRDFRPASFSPDQAGRTQKPQTRRRRFGNRSSGTRVDA